MVLTGLNWFKLDGAEDPISTNVHGNGESVPPDPDRGAGRSILSAPKLQPSLVSKAMRFHGYWLQIPSSASLK